MRTLLYFCASLGAANLSLYASTLLQEHAWSLGFAAACAHFWLLRAWEKKA